MRRLVTAFLEANRRTSHRINRWLDPDYAGLYLRFEERVAKELASLPSDAVVADLGGGRRFSFPEHLPSEPRPLVVAVDISPDELALNTDVDETRVADVATGLPFGDGEVDLILSRTLLEHVDGVPDAVADMARVLKPGGVAMHYVPCRYSHFGTLARLLPFGVLLKALHFVSPQAKGLVEFEVHYDHCYPSAMERLFRDAGFRTVTVEVTAAGSEYFWPLVPAYLVVAVYERIVKRLDARSLMSYMFVVAER